MTDKFFYENYKLSDLEIRKIYIKDNKLYMEFIQNAYLELIANGYRPEMNVAYDNVFMFDCNHVDINFKKVDLIDIKYIDSLEFVFKHETIKVGNNVEVKNN